jgi:6-phosphogluconolactonase (cycloisomerase 2 family)
MGNVYTQSNEAENKIINFMQTADGRLIEVQRVATGGKGTNGYVPVTGEMTSPDSLISANAVITSKDRTYLFAVNAGNNTVSCFRIGADGLLSLTDTQSTGNMVVGNAGTANSLAYNEADNVLYASHSFGPNHIRTFSVVAGKLILRPETQSVNLPGLNDRIPTQIALSPDNKFLLACVLFDARPGAAGLVPAAAKNLVTFPIEMGGTLGMPMFNEAGGVTPFATAFLNGRSHSFVTVLAAESSAVLSTLAANGNVMSTKPSKIETMFEGMMSEPSEICWISVSEDNRYAFGANFGYGTVSTFRIDANGLAVRISTAAKEVGDGMFKGLAGVTSSGAGDNAVSGQFLYQLYANAKKLVGYKIGDDGRLTKVTEVPVPYNSTQGLAVA